MMLPCSSNGTGKAFVKYHIIRNKDVARARGENQIAFLIHVVANKNAVGTSFSLFAVGFVVYDPVTSYARAPKDSESRYQWSFAKEELERGRGCFLIIH